MPYGQYAAAVRTVVQRLNQAGFAPEIIGPSHANMTIALEWYDFLQADGTTRGLIDELAYHRYGGVSQNVLSQIGQRTRSDSIRSGMLEHIGSGIANYEADLTTGNASAWQLLALAFCEGDSGGDFFVADISNPQNPTVRYSSNARLLPQYSRTVHRNAVRHGVQSMRGRLTPYAFRNPSGRWSVVVRAEGAQSFTVGGLPAGTYRSFYTTAGEFLIEQSEQTLGAGGVLTVTIPDSGVITIHQTQ